MLQAEQIAQPRKLLPSAFAQLGYRVRAHPKLCTSALLAAGLLIRILRASGTFLSPDEAMHFAAANQNSWWLTYKASLSLAHPPLLIFLLHIWRHLGNSELMLRLPSIVAGVAFCWISFRWMLLLFDEAVGWTAFVFLLFLPSSIQLSVEIRQYPLLLLFASACAYFLERALARNSVIAVLLSGVCLWLALLSHFSAVLLAVALGIYAIWRMLKGHFPLRLFAAWEFGQVIAIGWCYFLYVTQIVPLQQVYRGFSLTQGFTPDGFLAKYYFVPGKMNALVFVLARTGGFFQFAFQQLVIGDLALVFFVGGVVLIFSHHAFARVNSRALGLLLILPFILNCVAALVRAYPYGGTRHSAFLLPFAIAGVSVALTWICRSRPGINIAVAVALVLFCTFFPAKQFADAPPGAQRKENMNDAIGFLQQLPRMDLIFADRQSDLLLRHYFCAQSPVAANETLPDFVSYQCGGHQVVVARHDYIFNAQKFQSDWQDMTRKYQLGPNAEFWVAQIGPNMHLEEELGAAGRHLSCRNFGAEISFFAWSTYQPGLSPQ